MNELIEFLIKAKQKALCRNGHRNDLLPREADL